MFIIKHTLTGFALATTIVGGVFGAPAHAGELENRVVVTRYVTQWFNRTSTVSGIFAFGTGTGMIPPGVAPTRTGTGHSIPTGYVGYNHTVGVAPVKGSVPSGYVRYNGTAGVAPVKGNVTTVVSTVFVVPTSNGSMTTYEDGPTKAELHVSTVTTDGGIKPTATFDEELYGDANPDLLGKRGKRETVEGSLSASRAAQLNRHTTATRYFGFVAHTIIWRGVEPTHTPAVYQPSIDQPSIGKLVDTEIVAKLATFPHNGGDLDDEAFAKVIQDAEKTVRQSRPIARRDIDGSDVCEDDLIEFLNYLDLLGLIPTDIGLDKRDESLTGNVKPLRTLKQTIEEALSNVSKDFPGLPKDWFETHFDRPANRRVGSPSVDADVKAPSYNYTGAVNPAPVQGQVERKLPAVPLPTLAPRVPWLTADLLRKWAEQRYRNRRPDAAVEKRQVHEVGTAPQYTNSTGSVNYNVTVGEGLERSTGTAPKIDMKIPANLPLPTLAPQVPWLTADLLRDWLAHRHPKRDVKDVDAVEVVGQPLEVAKRAPGIRLGEKKMFKNLKSGDIAEPINGKRGRIVGEKDILKKIKPGMDAATPTTLIKVKATGVKAN